MDTSKQSFFVVVIGAMLISFVGCAKQTPAVGPGANLGADGRHEDAARVFSLGIPRGEVHLVMGDDVKIKVDINRGDKFLENVTIAFEPPAGLTLTPLRSTADARTDKIEGLVTAADGIEPGEYQIKVTGKSDSGYETSGAIDITVAHEKPAVEVVNEHDEGDNARSDQ